MMPAFWDNYFRYTWNEESKNETKKTILFTTPAKRIEYLG
jgi:hypothetical protein